jgi:alpha-methylacyl-CoA racemase
MCVCVWCCRLSRNKQSVGVDLKSEAGVAVVKQLVAHSHVVLDPFRPGVLEKLGLGPEVLLAINPRLVLARLTGYGQMGELSGRAGHDINYAAVSGVLSMLGSPNAPPKPPVNLLADFAGGSMFCVVGILMALLHQKGQAEPRGQIIDCAMVDGLSYLSSFIHLGVESGLFKQDQPGTNLLDGAAPFYGVYECKDGRFMSVGCLEPQFYIQFLGMTHTSTFIDLYICTPECACVSFIYIYVCMCACTARLGLSDDERVNSQFDMDGWDEMRRIFTATFLSQPRAHWERVFEGSDACVAPVLVPTELKEYKHHAQRGFVIPALDADSVDFLPAPAPRVRALCLCISVPLRVLLVFLWVLWPCFSRCEVFVWTLIHTRIHHLLLHDSSHSLLLPCHRTPCTASLSAETPGPCSRACLE